MRNDWYKHNPKDTIWWKDTPGQIGLWIFSFDQKKEYYMFRDYPSALTDEEKAIFDRENPYWKKFFADRQ
ncbi:MAG: hypothetical protein E7197_07645 [Anaerovibrio sp.]|nr:hypothetical protein [Anaerovibrio sp.]MBE6099912.1 hypothetical protein [Anaerovibrio sp.]